MRYILLFLLLTSCGGSGGGNNPTAPERPKEEAIYSVPADVEPWVQLFKNEAAARGITLPQSLIVEFVETIPGDENNPLILWGSCNNGNVPVIKLNNFLWHYDSSNRIKEMIIFHELGHCWLGLGHTESLFSLMNPSIINAENYIYYRAWRKEMLDELFNLVEPHDYAQDLVE